MGTVTAPGGPFNISNVDYAAINDAASRAYRKQTGQPSTVTGRTALKHLLLRVEEFLKYLKDKYRVPKSTPENDAILSYLQEVSRWYEDAKNTNYPGNPDSRIVAAMQNANHKSCIVYLDSILQGICAYKLVQFPPSDRPTYAANLSESDYFVGYMDSIGNV